MTELSHSQEEVYVPGPDSKGLPVHQNISGPTLNAPAILSTSKNVSKRRHPVNTMATPLATKNRAGNKSSAQPHLISEDLEAIKLNATSGGDEDTSHSRYPIP